MIAFGLDSGARGYAGEVGISFIHGKRHCGVVSLVSQFVEAVDQAGHKNPVCHIHVTHGAPHVGAVGAAIACARFRVQKQANVVSVA